MSAGWLYDGQNAVRHDVEVRVFGGRIEIDGHGSVAPGELEATGSMGGLVYGRKAVPGWRLGFDTPPDPAIVALLPNKKNYGGWVDRFGLLRSGAVLAAVSGVLVVVVLQLPSWIAPNIPMSWERQFGDAMVGDLSGKFCKGPGGQEALDTLVARIAPGEKIAQVHVIKSKMVNAVALPGGNVLIFDQLLKEAKSPDELAGVIGHELGHVKNRHVMQSLVRQAGFSILLGGFSGNTGGNLNMLLSTSYSRAAETEADGNAIQSLRRADVTPRDTADFFKRLAKAEDGIGAGDALNYVGSHPVSGGRAKQFEDSFVAGKAYRPTLSPEQWNTLVDICRNDPARKGDSPFSIF
jgi:beta-barrel assembly-enhancing protease